MLVVLVLLLPVISLRARSNRHWRMPLPAFLWKPRRLLWRPMSQVLMTVRSGSVVAVGDTMAVRAMPVRDGVLPMHDETVELHVVGDFLVGIAATSTYGDTAGNPVDLGAAVLATVGGATPYDAAAGVRTLPMEHAGPLRDSVGRGDFAIPGGAIAQLSAVAVAGIVGGAPRIAVTYLGAHGEVVVEEVGALGVALGPVSDPQSLRAAVAAADERTAVTELTKVLAQACDQQPLHVSRSWTSASADRTGARLGGSGSLGPLTLKAPRH